MKRASSGCSAPRLPALLLGWALPKHERGAAFGDLDEEYELFIRPGRGKLRADLWYWKQSFASLAPHLRRRREARRTPTPDLPLGRSRPLRRLDMDRISLDIRMALRTLRKRPGFTAVAVVTLALGIGANTAIFSLVNAVLLQPLPYSEPEELMTVWLDNRLQGWPQDVTSYPLYMDWDEQNRTFDGMSAWRFRSVNIAGDGEPQRIRGVAASPNLMAVLGAEAAHGRAFTPSDWDSDPNVVVLSHAFWQSRFGGDRGIVGGTVRLNDAPFTVIGVMPPGFAFGSTEALFWMPLHPDVTQSWRGQLWLNVVGRLGDDVTESEARADMDRVGRQLEEQYPAMHEGYGVTLVPLMDEVVGDVSTALWVLLGAVGFVMLIACANVANMSLARAATRASEMALRSALGADRRRLLYQMLTESVMLAALGGIAGLGVAAAGLRLLVSMDPDIPRLESVAIDGAVLAFTTVVALGTGMLFGIAPAVRVSRPDLNEALKEGARTAAGGITGRFFRQSLVVAQIALALVLLVGAGLLIRSYAELRSIDLGFEPDGLLMTSITLPGSSYPESGDVYRFFSTLLESVDAMPGIASVAAVDAVPLGSRFSSGFFVIAGRPPVARAEMMEVKFNTVTPGYFETMRTPVLAGRLFEPADSIDRRPVVVINETMRRIHFPAEDPVGQLFLFGQPEDYATEDDPSPELPWLEIVGIVADVPQRSVRQPAEPEVFLPYAEGRGDALTLVVRSLGDVASIAGPVRAQIRTMDPDLPVADQGPVSDLVAASSAQERLNFRLLGVFALLALSLAGVGIYGVMSYTVSQRTREIGIRMALGASTADVTRSVLGPSMWVTAIGLAIGTATAFLAGSLVSSLLYGIEATDPITFTVVAVALGAIALAASLIPALRAARLDPTLTLRD